VKSSITMALPEPVKLLIACGGIFFSFSYFAVLQEDVYKKTYGEDKEKFTHTLLAIFVERGINALVALVGMALLGGSGVKIPHTDIFNSGVSQMLAMAASNEALRYVSFPTQILGKSCKMVPVMIGGILLGGKTYTLAQYAQVILITVGVCVFNFGGKSKKGADDSSYGLALIVASLVMDMVTGGLQDRVKMRTKELNPEAKGAKPTMHESMFYTNLSGAIVALALAAVSSDLLPGVQFCLKYPEVTWAILVYSLASAVGQNFIYYTVTQFSPLLLSTVTTTRKIFSTLYSIFRDPSNVLSTMQWSGCGLVFLGIFVDLAAGAMSKPKGAASTATKPMPPAKAPRRSKKAD